MFISRNSGTVGLDELLDTATLLHHSADRSALASAALAISDTINYLLDHGCRIELPLLDLYIKASGSAEDECTPFTPQNRNTDHCFTLHALVHKQERLLDPSNVKWERKETFFHNDISPKISGTEYWANGTLVVKGRNLDFSMKSDTDGIFAVTWEDEKTIHPRRILSCRNTEIAADFSNLEPGCHSLVIRRRGQTAESSFNVPAHGVRPVRLNKK